MIPDLLLDRLGSEAGPAFRHRPRRLRLGATLGPPAAQALFDIDILPADATLAQQHRDLGGGRFRFTLEIRHPLWGRTFRQAGEFVDPAAGEGVR